MSQRPLNHKQRSWLLGELPQWRAAAGLTPEQEAAMLGLYESPAARSERLRGRLLFAISALAVLLVGMGVLLLMGYNWRAIPRVGKLLIVLAGVSGTYATAYVLRYRRQQAMASEIVAFLGCLLYGVGIWLVAQAYHLKAHYPDGVWWWALGVLPLALLLDTALLHALLVGLLGTYAGMEIVNFAHLGGWLFGGRWGAIPNGAYSLLPFAALGLLWAYRKGSAITVTLYVLLLAWWVILQPFAWRLSVNPVPFIASVGAVLLLAGASHGAGSRLARPYWVLGLLLASGALLPLSFHEFNEEFDEHALSLPMFFQTMSILLLGAGLLLVTRWRQRARPAEARLTWNLLWYPLALWLALVAMILLAPWPLAPTILANLALVAGAFWLLLAGLHSERGGLFALGVLQFLLWAILRYIDLFGAFGGMLGAALVFFLCGGALFGFVAYWQRRRRTAHE